MQRHQQNSGIPEFKTLMKIFNFVWPIMCWLTLNRYIDAVIRKVDHSHKLRVVVGIIVFSLAAGTSFLVLCWLFLASSQYFDLSKPHMPMFEAHPLVLAFLWLATPSLVNTVFRFLDFTIAAKR